jgi:hypothetical protein
MTRVLRKIGVVAVTAVLAIGLPIAGPATPAVAAGAGRPTAETTGVPVGVTLAPMTGGTVSTSATTIADRVITGDVLFTGSSLTLRNVRVTGEAIFRGSGIVVEDSEFGAVSVSGATNIRLSRVDVFGSAGRDGVHITSDSGRASDVVLEDVWIHNPSVTASSHYDGIQVRGVDRLTLRRVAVELGAYQPQQNAALFLENANGGNRSVTVEDSWILGGGYAFYSFAADVRIRRTTFGGARWGHLFPQSQAANIVEFADNRDTGGTPLGLRAVGTSTYQMTAVDPVDRARKQAFVRALHQDFLGRAPSDSDLLHWVSRLDLGMSRYDVATALSRTDAWISAVITRFYRDTLNREPDAAGLASWVKAAREGAPIAQIASAFYGSDEYLARMAGGDQAVWVRDLYTKLLYRGADPVGLAAWLDALAAGAPRARVAFSFYQADETSRVRVQNLYLALLGRGADPSGLAGWPPIVRVQGDLVLAAFLASSDEYYQRAQSR